MRGFSVRLEFNLVIEELMGGEFVGLGFIKGLEVIVVVGRDFSN